MAAFAIHALLPFISIESKHDLEATAAFLAERNQWIETAHDRIQDDTNSKLAHA